MNKKNTIFAPQKHQKTKYKKVSRAWNRLIFSLTWERRETSLLFFKPKTKQTHLKHPRFQPQNPAFHHQFHPFQPRKKTNYNNHFTKFTHRNPQTLTTKQESKTDLSAEFNTHFAVRKTENGTFPHKIEDPRLENAVFSWENGVFKEKNGVFGWWKRRFFTSNSAFFHPKNGVFRLRNAESPDWQRLTQLLIFRIIHGETALGEKETPYRVKEIEIYKFPNAASTPKS